MSGVPTRSVATEEETPPAKEEMSLEQKIGMARKFDREMKDYAKATVKEFLGIYGYEEEVDLSMDENEKTESLSSVESRPTQSNVSPARISSDVEKASDALQPSVSISSSTNNVSGEGSGQYKRTSLPEDVNDANSLSVFSWDEYLAEVRAVAAPWTCFKQAATPPFNAFQCGMKVEAADPRNEGAVCVATVVGVVGCRLRLRFDGCGDSRDIWRLIDSGDIHPVGWCEGNGGVLQPPVGFSSDARNFSNFLKKTLANGELAPLKLFKKEPHTPKGNMFCRSHKLEAVDLSDPALICVATVIDIAGDEVKISMDRCKMSPTYTYRYDSRDIFPAGWCYFSGHPLQTPGPEYKKLKPSISLKEQSSISSARHLAASHTTYPQRSTGSPVMSWSHPTTCLQPLGVLHPPHQTLRSVAHQTSSINVLANPSQGSSQSPQNPHESTAVANADSPSSETLVIEHRVGVAASRRYLQVELFVNHACDVGSYLDPAKVVQLPSVYRGHVREVLQISIQDIVNAAYNPSIVIGFLRPGRGKIIIKAVSGKDTYTCCLQSVDHTWVFWSVFHRFTDNLRCCKNLFCEKKLQAICPKCQNQGSIMPRMVESNATALKRRREEESHDDTTEADICSTSSPLTWSIEEVVDYFRDSDISKYAEVFRDHEIDGGALMLLNRESIMSCMKFKLGPALKLLNHISELKEKFGL